MWQTEALAGEGVPGRGSDAVDGGILVVDDTPSALHLMSDLLTAAGYRVRPASSGPLALRSAFHRVPELVLLDVQMPGMDGFEVCRRLKGDPRTEAVPVVFLSALRDTESRVRGLQAGALDFISKPFQAEEVLARVRTHLLLGRTMRALDRMCADLQQEAVARSSDLAEVSDALARQVLAHGETARRLRLASRAVEAALDGIVVTDADGVVLTANPASSDLTGWTRQDLVGRRATTLLADAEALDGIAHEMRAEDGRGRWSGEAWLTGRDGDPRPVWLSVSEFRDADGRVTNFLGVFADLRPRKAAEERIAYLDQHDPLTGLPSRLLLRDRFETARAGRGDARLALVTVDVDAFKAVNDSLGHPVGDEYLRSVARSVAAALGDADTLCRIGGDEFVALLPAAHADADLAAAADRLRRAVGAEVEVAGHRLHRTASLGVAIYPDDGTDFDDLLRKADAAMAAAKQSGRDTVAFHTPEMTRDALARLRKEADLGAAIADGGVRLRYQPKVDMRTGRIVGLEALARWNTPDGEVGPDAFIPLAEACGLVVPMGAALLRMACRQAREWLDAGVAVPVSVNVSPVEVRHGHLGETVAGVLDESGLPGSLLTLELIESSLVGDTDTTWTMLDLLRQRGVGMDLDDFLTGYSNFAYLRRFPVTHLKIDKSFVQSMSPGSQDHAIVTAAISMASALGIPTIAEGVETTRQRDLLLAAGCTVGQGFLYDRPLTPQDTTERLRRGTCPPRPASP